jgi:hypothetical protein
MDAYFMILNFKTLFQLLLGKGCEIDLFLSDWLDHIFSNRELYIIHIFSPTEISTSFNKTMTVPSLLKSSIA